MLKQTGFEPKPSDLWKRLLCVSPQSVTLTTWNPICLATVNICYNTGLHNVEKLAASQLAVWWSSGQVKKLGSESSQVLVLCPDIRVVFSKKNLSISHHPYQARSALDKR